MCAFRTHACRFLSMALLAGTCGCSSHDVVTVTARPGKFRLYSCDELNKHGVDTLKRERELADLMRRAEQGPGGRLAGTIAYRTEYDIVLGELREVELAGIEKNCVLKHRPISEQAVR